MKITKEKFGKEVTKLQGTVQNLQHDANALDEEAKQFQGLVDELKNIAEDNEHIMELLDHTNQTFNDMRECVLENERAYLLTQYYKCAFRGLYSCSLYGFTQRGSVCIATQTTTTIWTRGNIGDS